MEKIFITPLKIKRQGQCLSNPYILKYGPTQVKYPTLHARTSLMRETLLADTPLVKLFPTIIPCPLFRVVFKDKVKFTGLKAFQRNHRIFKIFNNNPFKII